MALTYVICHVHLIIVVVCNIYDVCFVKKAFFRKKNDISTNVCVYVYFRVLRDMVTSNCTQCCKFSNCVESAGKGTCVINCAVISCLCNTRLAYTQYNMNTLWLRDTVRATAGRPQPLTSLEMSTWPYRVSTECDVETNIIVLTVLWNEKSGDLMTNCLSKLAWCRLSREMTSTVKWNLRAEGLGLISLRIRSSQFYELIIVENELSRKWAYKISLFTEVLIIDKLIVS